MSSERPTLTCVVYTPFGAMNAIAYIRQHRADFGRLHLCVISTNDINHRQIRALIDNADLPRLTLRYELLYAYRLGWRKVLNYLSLIRCRMRISQICGALAEDDTLLFSHLTNYFTQTFYALSRKRSVRFIAVDDGVASFSDFLEMDQLGSIAAASHPRNSARNFTMRFIIALYRHADLQAKDFTFYSMFPLSAFAKGGKVAQITRRDVTQRRNVDAAPLSKQVFFIGQPLVKRGYTDSETYTALIRGIAAHYRSQGLEMIYFPHRSETPDRDQLACEIRWLDEPFELYIMRIETLPEVIAGIYSTCILTSHYLLGDAVRIDAHWHIQHSLPGLPFWGSSSGSKQLFEYEARHSEHFQILTD